MMDYTKATDEQIKTIIEWDADIPTPLLKEVYEEAMKRRIFDSRIYHWIYKCFDYKEKAERKTGLAIEDLLWICYEAGYENIEHYKPIKSFADYWYMVSMNKIRTAGRITKAQKRKGDVCSLEDIAEWTIPGGNHTEPIALNRVYIESIMKQLTETEKEIVFKRYEGYTYSEIAAMQGVSYGGIQKRIVLYQKRLKGA